MKEAKKKLFTEVDFQEAKSTLSDSIYEDWVILFISLIGFILLVIVAVGAFHEMSKFSQVASIVLPVIVIFIVFRRGQILYEDKKSRGILVDLYQMSQEEEDSIMTKENVMLKVGLWPCGDIRI